MIITTKKAFEREVKRRVDRKLLRIETLQRLYKAERRLNKAENKIHKLYARIGMLEKQQEEKGSIKGYYMDADGLIKEITDKED